MTAHTTLVCLVVCQVHSETNGCIWRGSHLKLVRIRHVTSRAESQPPQRTHNGFIDLLNGTRWFFCLFVSMLGIDSLRTCEPIWTHWWLFFEHFHLPGSSLVILVLLQCCHHAISLRIRLHQDVNTKGRSKVLTTFFGMLILRSTFIDQPVRIFRSFPVDDHDQ